MTRFCLYGGALVSATRRLPGEVSEFRFTSPAVGCNHLRCASCGEAVRWEAEGAGRRYRCGCAEHWETEVTLLDGARRDPLAPRWACAGHPEVDAAALTRLGFVPGAGFLAQVQAALAGQPDAPTDLPPGEHRGYTADLRIELAGPEGAQAREVVEGALDDGDAKVRRRAVDVLVHRGWVPAVDAAFRWRRWLDVPDPFVPTQTLADAWAVAVGRQAVRDGQHSPAAEVGRALREAGAKARVLRGL